MIWNEKRKKKDELARWPYLDCHRRSVVFRRLTFLVNLGSFLSLLLLYDCVFADDAMGRAAGQISSPIGSSSTLFHLLVCWCATPHSEGPFSCCVTIWILSCIKSRVWTLRVTFANCFHRKQTNQKRTTNRQNIRNLFLFFFSFYISGTHKKKKELREPSIIKLGVNIKSPTSTDVVPRPTNWKWWKAARPDQARFFYIFCV